MDPNLKDQLNRQVGPHLKSQLEVLKSGNLKSNVKRDTTPQKPPLVKLTSAVPSKPASKINTNPQEENEPDVLSGFAIGVGFNMEWEGLTIEAKYRLTKNHDLTVGFYRFSDPDEYAYSGYDYESDDESSELYGPYGMYTYSLWILYDFPNHIL